MTQFDNLTEEERVLDGLMDSHCPRPNRELCNEWTRDGGTCIMCPHYKFEG